MSSVTTVSTTAVPVPTGLPDSVTSTAHHHHAGAIVGGVIGGLALLVAVIGVFLFYRSRSKGVPARLRRRTRGSTFGSGTFKKWDGSHDYGHGSTLPAYSEYGAAYKSSPSRHPSTGSGAYMLSGHTNSIGHSYYGDEKTPPASSQGHEPLEPMPYNQYNFDIPPPAVPATPTTAAFPPGRPRERSVTQDRAQALAKLNAPGSPTSPGSPYNSFDYGYNRQSLDGRILASPPMSPTAAVQQGELVELKRRSSSTRRMQRKAVPKYDENEFAEAPSASVSRAASTSAPAASAPARTPTPPHAVPIAVEEAKAAVGSGSRGSSSTNLHDGSATLHEEHIQRPKNGEARVSWSRDELLAAGHQIPRLTEKASWGDMRNVHYLIPDMPAPQRD